MALTDNIVAYWKLDETSGNVSDSVSGGVNNTFTNNNTVTFSSGKINNGADMVGTSSQSLSTTDAAQTGLKLTGDWTLSFWMKGSTTGEQYLINFTNNTNGDGFAVGTQVAGGAAGKIKCLTGLSWAADSTSNTYFSGSWVHVVVTLSGTTVTYYKNGSADGTGTAAAPGWAHTPSFAFGCAKDTAAQFLTGSIDEIGLWSRALSSTEVTSLYNSGNGFSYPFSTSVAYTCSSLNSMVLSDINILAATYPLTITNTLVDSDISTLLSTYNVSITDTIISSDLASVLKGYFETIVENLTVNDSISNITQLGLSVVESLTVGDTLTSAQQVFVVSVVDLLLSDAGVSVGLEVGITIEETLALRDSLVRNGWSWQTKNGSGSDWTYQTKNF